MKSFLPVCLLSAGGLLIAGCATTPPPAPPPAKAAPAATPPPAVATPDPTPAAVSAPAAPAVLSDEAKAVVERLTEPEVGGVRHAVLESTGFPQALASLEVGAAVPGIDQPVNYANQPPTRGLTADGATAELVERDWTGVVLAPINADFGRAVTSLVKLTSIEAHPLKDGRVRAWIRVRNVAPAAVQVGVACRFQMKELGEATSPRFYSLSIPAGEYRDVFFLSPAGSLTNYTVLVKAGN